MKPDTSPSLSRERLFSPRLPADRKTVLWIALVAVFVWIVVSDSINGGKSLLLHFSLTRQLSLGQDDAEIAGRLVRIDRKNREILGTIGRLKTNRQRFEEHAGQIGEIFGRKLSLKKSAPRSVPNVPELESQKATIVYKAHLEEMLADLPEWKALARLPGVSLRSFAIAPGSTPGMKTATIVYRIAGARDKTNGQTQRTTR
uniref:Uncharacterized protein n=1 Tax=Leptospirillum ferrodiazotrophum TaxID=412449 RepID=C6HTY4_9BACT|nr:MAG: protein of unknown function [Leptospirillum ferrodiazotrophum]